MYSSHPGLSLISCATLKVSANVLLGRSHVGVHWRMDGVNGAVMGETGAIRRLQQVRKIVLGLLRLDTSGCSYVAHHVCQTRPSCKQTGEEITGSPYDRE